MNIDDINSRTAEIAAELEVLAGLTDPTEEDEARSAALLAEGEQLVKDKQEANERRQAIADAHARQKVAGQAIPGASFEQVRKGQPYDVDLRMLGESEVRDAARSILDRPEARHLRDDQRKQVDRLIEHLDPRLSRYVVAGSRPEYRAAFNKYITGNVDLMTNDERRAVAEFRALALADASGGFAVPPLLDPSIILTSDGSVNPMRQVARIVTGMDDTWRGVSSAGVTASWDSEGVQVSDDTPTLAQPTVTAWKAQAFVPFSVEIEGDWAGLAAEMSVLFADAKDTLETTAFATGNGTDKPFGILTDMFAASATVGVLPTTDGQFGAVDVRNVFGQVPPRWRTNASWMASIDVQNEIRGFDTTGGLSNQTVDLTQPYSFALLGKPFYENSGFPTFTGTTGASNILVVGDLRAAYTIFDRVGSRVELVPHLMGANGRPTGQRGLLFWWRVGGKTIVPQAARLLLNA
jgi:HK97 family phage major capsid protein